MDLSGITDHNITVSVENSNSCLALYSMLLPILFRNYWQLIGVPYVKQFACHLFAYWIFNVPSITTTGSKVDISFGWLFNRQTIKIWCNRDLGLPLIYWNQTIDMWEWFSHACDIDSASRWKHSRPGICQAALDSTMKRTGARRRYPGRRILGGAFLCRRAAHSIRLGGERAPGWTHWNSTRPRACECAEFHRRSKNAIWRIVKIAEINCRV